MKNIHNKIALHFIALLFTGLFVGCEGFKEQYVDVNIEVENVEPIIVMNAEIEKDSIVWIQISYSEDIDALVGTPVRYEENAMVVLETGQGEQETLRYWKNGIYYGVIIKGKVNETYTLKVNINDMVYKASSTMFAAPGYQAAWVNAVTGKGKGTYYSDEWIVNDPSATRNHYLFEWYTNGVHMVRQDWSIDDNRVVNVNAGLRLFNVTMNPGANEYTVLRAAEIDKPTYNYYNMYEKIVRGLVGASSQTPYNPTSNFGEGTMGNFRAVEFSAVALLTPPNIAATGQNTQNVISFPANKYFTKYNLYWSNAAGVTKENANVITDIKFYTNTEKTEGKGDGKEETSKSTVLFYAHTGLTNGETYYYRIETLDAAGNESILSPEEDAVPDPDVPADKTSDDGGDSTAPTNVSAMSGTNSGEIVITWDKVSAAKPVYGIYWNTKPNINEKLPRDNQIWSGKNADVSSPYTLKGLKSGTTYYFRVAVWDGKSVSLSAEVSALAK